MYRLAILPPIFVEPMNIQLYIFGMASLECLGQQGGSKNLSGHSPGLNSWHLEDISESLLDDAEGRSIGEGFQHSNRKQKICLSTQLSHQLPMRRGKASFLNLSVLGVQADGRMICLCKVLGTSEVPTWPTAVVPDVQAAV